VVVPPYPVVWKPAEGLVRPKSPPAALLPCLRTGTPLERFLCGLHGKKQAELVRRYVYLLCQEQEGW